MSHRPKIVLITALAVFMGFLDATIVNIAFPDIERSFPDASRADLVWVLNAYNIVFAALLVPAGRFADRIGRRRLFMIGIALFLAASLACAAAPSAEVLVAARVVQAVGAAILIPTSLALLLPEFPISQRATAVGLWGIGAALAAAAGPSLGGLVVDKADWRWVFFANLPIGAFIVAYGRGVLREYREPGRAARPDLLGSALLAVALGALALAIVEGPDWGWGGARVVGAFAAAAVGLVLFLWRCAHHPAPVIELPLLRVRSFACANAGSLLFATGFYAMLLCNVLFLTTVWGYSFLTAGAALTPTPLMTAALAGPFGRLADRVGHITVIVPGCVLYSAAATWYATRVGVHPHYVSQWLPPAIAMGIGIALAFPVFASAAVHSVPSARFALGSGVNAAARQIGAVIGVSMVVAILGTPSPAEAADAFSNTWSAISIVALCAGAAGLAIGQAVAAPDEGTAATPEPALLGEQRLNLDVSTT
jgi:EmrB/QacA subfamily drug resistance transporter